MKDHPGDFSSESAAVRSLTHLTVLRDEERRGRMILWLRFKKSTLIPAFLALSAFHCQWLMSNSFPVFFYLSDRLHFQPFWDNWGLLWCRVELNWEFPSELLSSEQTTKYVNAVIVDSRQTRHPGLITQISYCWGTLLSLLLPVNPSVWP